MRVLTVMAVLQLCFSSLSHSQIVEHFNAPPVPWQGTDTAWQVSNGMLQSNCLQTNSRFWLWTPAGISLPAAWEWWMQLDFNTSSNNYVDVFLAADSSALLHPGLSGCFVRIGGKNDEVCLYACTPADRERLLIDGRDGLTNRSASVLKVRVTCDEAHHWRLWTDSTGTGLHYVPVGGVTDSSIAAAPGYGIVVRQSTASFFRKHFFDEVEVARLVKDTLPPAPVSLAVLGDRELLLQFSEPVDSVTALATAAYQLSGTAAHPVRVALEGAGVHLFFAAPFPGGDSLQLQVAGVRDVAGNEMRAAALRFLFYRPRAYEVLIQEILPDPEPAPGPLLAEFVELRNTSAYPVQLRDWQLRTRGGTVRLPACQLEPDSLVLLCRKEMTDLFAGSGAVLGLDRFPALYNESDTLMLYDADGAVMHAVAYNKNWYGDEEKKNGGWSLEMISAAAPCTGAANWRAALDPAGSTPGRPNSVAGPGDTTVPRLEHASLQDSATILLRFSHALDSAQAAQSAGYRLLPGPVSIARAVPLSPLFQEVQLHLSNPLGLEGVYTLEMAGPTDCKGVPVTATATLARAAAPDSGTVLISELLFDARSPAPEFVEIHNPGARAIDLQQLYIALLDEDSLPRSSMAVGTAGGLLLPGQYLALTRDPAALCRYYTCKAFDNILQVPALPAFPNEGGTLALYNGAGRRVDIMFYSPDMQLPLADNAKGVSLERLSFQRPAQDPHNWHAAAATAGHATPGSPNSQQLLLQELPGEVTVQPALFSPDNDGMEDMAVITCRLPRPGFIGNITVFDAQGRPVRQLLRNSVLGNEDTIIWDGLGENKQLLPVGIYIIFTEIFDLEGRIKRWKLPVALVRRMS
ncbi:lamin tail domain-containing protein [Chitinophaga japonensis]|uniref:Lamin tail-like protein n=1 Tax=Chitinophaga japonensis TaxID=104662 RepID=A0A562TDC6_CHIJA|nr:lamin tail domain-containing protein [Chitinophaga japonensis]TWI91519.1 lamin tail-like protein [Chitinophaga japonensis]